MASQWTNKYAILRDLSFAQGRKVPTDIVGSVGINEKPPTTTVEEETEEEYIQNGGDGELHTKPDLFMIKHMLDWVNEVDVVNDDDTETDKLVQISKLNPSTSPFVPKSSTNNDKILSKTKGFGDNNDTVVSKIFETDNSVAVLNHIGSGDHNVTKKIDANNVQISDKPSSSNINCIVNPKKKRRERNVALIALLEKEQLNLADNSSQVEGKIESMPYKAQNSKLNTVTTNKDEPKEFKLLKPNDFMVQMNDSDLTVIQAHEKVTEWLQTPVDHQGAKIKPITVTPTNMFKKKKPIAPILESGSMFKRKSDTSSIKSSDSDPGRNQSNSTFVPSTQANEYYKKYVERSMVQKTLQEDIWEKAERVMKEIEAKRLKEKEDKLLEQLAQAISSTNQTDDQSDERDGNIRPVDDNSEKTDAILERGDAISKQGDAISKQEEAISKQGDAISKQGDAISKQGGTISKQGDTISKQGDAILDQGYVNSEQTDALSEETKSNRSSASLHAALQGIDIVRLPQHRHELPEECKVCLVLAKYKPTETSDSLMRL